MCVGILLRSLAKLSGREPAVHQFCLRLEKKKREKHTEKKQPTDGRSSSHPEPFFLLFSHRFYCCPGQSLKLWILRKCFPKSDAQIGQDGECFSVLSFNVFQMPELAPSTLQAHSTSRWEWHLLPSSSSPPCAYYGLVKLFPSPSGPSLRTHSSCEDLSLPPALPKVHHNNQKCETSSCNTSELFPNSLKKLDHSCM